MNNKPIGVFDSGIGGLTVLHELIKALPNENFIYLGDTARVPYGNRSKETVTDFALELTKFLLSYDLKYLVVACNTISAICLDKIKKISSVPVIDVITPAVNRIVELTKSKKVGVIGTKATISSGIYETEIKDLDSNIKVYTRACPLFVPIAEEGLGDSEIAYLVAKKYLEFFKDKEIDILHLGCTHYPLLKKVIQKVIGDKITIIDSAIPTAKKLKEELRSKNLEGISKNPEYQFFVTDDPEKMRDIAEIFLGKRIKVNIQKAQLT